MRAALVSAGYRCVTPDSIAHGASTIPQLSERYKLSERTADVLAVADAVGADQFAFVGYSMGAWIGMGLLAESSQRVPFCLLAGWDPLRGAHLFTKTTDPKLRNREFMDLATALLALRPGAVPETAECLQGMARCYEQLFAPLPSLELLSVGAAAATPAIAVFCGNRDPYFDNAKDAAHRLTAQFATCEGDHLTTFNHPHFTQQALRWIERAWPVPERARAVRKMS